MRYVLLGCFSILFSVSTQAELIECEGVWTNQPCESSSASGIKEKPFQEATKDTLDRDRKRALVQSLASSRRTLEKSLGVRIETSEVENLCLSPQTTLELCREEVKFAQEMLIQQAEIVKLSQKENQEPKAEGSESETRNVVIVDNRNPNFWVLRPRRRFPQPRFPRGAGLGVSASGSAQSGNTTISGKVSAGFESYP